MSSLCARCGEPAAGFATIGEERYCHGDASPSCYERQQWGDSYDGVPFGFVCDRFTGCRGEIG